jgi:hypothetical protein
MLTKQWILKKKPYVTTIKPVENFLASNLVTRISDEVRDETSWNKILCARKIVENVIICTLTLEHHEFQREKGKNLLFGCIRHLVCLGNERPDSPPCIRNTNYDITNLRSDLCLLMIYTDQYINIYGSFKRRIYQFNKEANQINELKHNFLFAYLYLNTRAKYDF